MRCVVVTPEMTVLDREATFVALPLYDGELGIAPGHTPLIGRIGGGELRISTSDSDTKSDTVSYYVEGGFVEVLDNTVTLLTGRAVPVAQLDAAQSQRLLSEVQAQKAVTEESIERRMRDADYLRSQIRLVPRA